jgi:hypothetical protein
VLLAGAAVSLGTLAGVLLIAYKAWYAGQVGEDRAAIIVSLLSLVYAGGAYIFAYAWERGDQVKALRLTLVILVGSVAAVLVAAAAMSLLSRARGGSALLEDRSPLGPSGLARAAASYVEQGRVQLEPEAAPSELMTITCEKCGQAFIPLPPRALCPFCGWAALSTPAA